MNLKNLVYEYSLKDTASGKFIEIKVGGGRWVYTPVTKEAWQVGRLIYTNLTGWGLSL